VLRRVPEPDALAPLALAVREAALLRGELVLLLERAELDRRDRVAVVR
jgi:hypothetical protein